MELGPAKLEKIIFQNLKTDTSPGQIESNEEQVQHFENLSSAVTNEDPTHNMHLNICVILDSKMEEEFWN